MQKVKDLFTPDVIKEKRKQSLSGASGKDASAEGAEGQVSQSKGPSAEGAEGQTLPSKGPSAEGSEGQTTVLDKGPSAEGSEGQTLPSGGISAEGSEGQNPSSGPTVGTSTTEGVKDSTGSYGASPGVGVSSYTGEEGGLNRDDPTADTVRRPFAKQSEGLTETSRDTAVSPLDRGGSYEAAAASSGLPGSYDVSGSRTTSSVMPGTYATTPGTEDAPITNNAPQIGSTNAPQIGQPDVGENFSEKEVVRVEQPYSERRLSAGHTTFTGNRLDPRTSEQPPFHDEPSNVTHSTGVTSTAIGSTDTGPASKTVGPHESNLANVVDPRVKPEPEKQISGTGDATGPASNTVGPHESNLANVVDPRVKPEPEAQTSGTGDITGPASSTIGPHKSNLANIVDPRVKPEPELMKPERRKEINNELERDAAIGGGAAVAGGALGYEVGKHHDSSAAAPATTGPTTTTAPTTTAATTTTTTAPTTTTLSTTAPAGTTTTAVPPPQDKLADRSVESDKPEKERKSSILGFLHRDKDKDKDKKSDHEKSEKTKHDKHHGDEGKTAAVAGSGAAGALAAEEVSDSRRRSSATPYTTEHHLERELKYDEQTKGGVLGFLHKDQKPKYQDPDEPNTTAREKYFGLDGATRPADGGDGSKIGPTGLIGGAAVGGGAAAAAAGGEELFDHHDPISSKHTRGSSRHFTDKDYETAPVSTEGKSQTHHSIFHHDSVGPNRKHGDTQGATTGATTGAATGTYGNDTYGASAPVGAHHGQGVGGSNEGVIPAGTTSDGYPTSWIDEVGANKKSLAGDGMGGTDEHGRPSLSSEGGEQKRGLLDKILHRENPNKLHKDPPS